MNPFLTGDEMVALRRSPLGAQGVVVGLSLLTLTGGYPFECIDVDFGPVLGLVTHVNPGDVSLYFGSKRYGSSYSRFSKPPRVTCKINFPYPQDMLGESGIVLESMYVKEGAGRVDVPYFLVRFDSRPHFWLKASDLDLEGQALSISPSVTSGASCSSCGDYNQYVINPYTCYGCRQNLGVCP